MWSGTKLTLQLSQSHPTRPREYTTKAALSSSWTSALRTLAITQLSKNTYLDQTFWCLDTYILINTENPPCKTFPADLCAVRITQPPIWMTDNFFAVFGLGCPPHQKHASNTTWRYKSSKQKMTRHCCMEKLKTPMSTNGSRVQILWGKPVQTWKVLYLLRRCGYTRSQQQEQGNAV